MYSFIDKCRICLRDDANHPIFIGINKESIQCKLFQCFKEKIEDIDGYPRNICKLCYRKLHTLCNFITKYKTSCEWLESKVVKTEVCSENESDNVNVEQETDLLNTCKSESDELETCDNSKLDQPLILIQKKELSLAEIKVKIKSLPEIKFKKKPVQKRKNIWKNGKAMSSNRVTKSTSTDKSKMPSELKKPDHENTNEKNNVDISQLPETEAQFPEPSLPKLCDICGETFTDSKLLLYHQKKRHHNEPKQCPKCSRTLASEYYMKRHLKRVHGTREFPCDQCGKAFAFKKEVAYHIKAVHLKQGRPHKKYSCDKCDKEFVRSTNLVIHERSAHTGLRPAICTLCDAHFYHEQYLRQHMRLHTGEAPFKCPICDRGYAQSSNMKSHISHNHRLADLSPETIKNLKRKWFKFLKKP